MQRIVFAMFVFLSLAWMPLHAENFDSLGQPEAIVRAAATLGSPA